ncbi:hypothetical protein HRbin36_02622 [bacterium HR36]|uniref:Hypothetical conserved protein n=1 Tax=uncultured Planctomycetota bacterium TaxID=120965 RepID=H5S891_9BACT|nr:hypothetical conserved protein [uncultured Planctomycetota bacterium]GBD37488.1 hypothetical protein HRbin36_02622 [bacterium HR36]
MLQRWIVAINNAFEQVLLGVGLLTLRISFGLGMLLGHGLEKALNFGQLKNLFPDPLGLGPTLSLALCVFAEVICAGLVTIGLLTRLACVPLIINMLVAFLIIHAQDPWVRKELAFVYFMGYITILLTGPGPFALDTLFRRRSPPQT